MNVTRRVAILAAIALSLTAASFGQQVKTDFDRNADFSRYKTYSWGNVQTADPLLVDRIKTAVSSALSAKGWTLVESGGEVAVMAMEMNEAHQTLQTYYDNFGGGWGWRGWGGWGDGLGTSTTTEHNYTVGTLVVDLFDSRTKKLLWRGAASDTVHSKSATNIRNLDKGVEKMFERFPPELQKAEH